MSAATIEAILKESREALARGEVVRARALEDLALRYAQIDSSLTEEQRALARTITEARRR